jgi:hypothetical protein
MSGFPKNYTVKDTRKTLQQNNANYYKRKELSKDEKQLETIKRRKIKQTDKYQTALANGWKDHRKFDKKCRSCNLIYCDDLNTDNTSNDTHTICGLLYETRTRHIYWNGLCMSCQRKWGSLHKRSYESFTRLQAYHLRRHMNGTVEHLMTICLQIRERCNNRCASCGILVIANSKSGWMQESFNMVHPDLYSGDEKESAKESHIAVSCFACNCFQNDYAWNIHIENLIALSKPPPTQRNNDISHINSSWVRYCGNSGGNYLLKRALLARDGKYCAASGIELSFEKGFWNTASVDRIDNGKGHTLDNCRLVAAHINYVKYRSIDEIQLQQWISHIRSIGEDVIRKNGSSYIVTP